MISPGPRPPAVRLFRQCSHVSLLLRVPKCRKMKEDSRRKQNYCLLRR